MIKVNIDTSGILRIKAELEGKGKQVRFATLRALNAGAYAAAQATKAEMRRVFDKPTPWVLGSVRYKKATKEKLEAQVDFDFWGNKQGVTVAQVLRAEIYGGPRRLKRFEVALQRRGILPAGMAAIPTKRAPRDQYGNVSTGLITQMLSFFDAFGEQGYRANMGAKGREKRWKTTKKRIGFEFFALQQQQGKLFPGIYMRKNYGAADAARVSHLQSGGAYALFFFVPIPKYKRLLDFYGVAEKAALKEYNAQFPVMLEQAMRTAR